MRDRYPALDSLRGIAAITVVFDHFSYLTPFAGLRHSPLRLIMGGHEAVVLFFVLSGFVLALQLSKSAAFAFQLYALRRFVRIYLPYIFSMMSAFACFALSHALPVAWAGHWFNSTWQALPAGVLLGHLFFVLPFSTDALVPVVWSLVYEMRISLIIPLLVLLVARMPLAMTATLSVALSVLTFVLMHASNTSIIFASIDAAWAPTLHYTVMFIMGVVLAKHREAIIQILDQSYLRRSVFALSLLCYFSGSPIGFHFHSLAGDMLYDWCVMLGVAGILSCALTEKTLGKTLQHPMLLFLGKISYSVYLTHTIVLLFTLHMLNRILPPIPLTFIALLLVVPVGYLSYRFIERPSIALSRHVGNRAKLYAVRPRAA